MTRSRKLFVGVAMLVTACQDDAPFAPTREISAPAPATVVETSVPAMLSPATVALPACTHHWANANGGAWFTAGNWSPATVPGSASTACIDAAGTYTVTLDPPNDATPVDLDGLAIGGVASGTQTVLVKGVGASVNVAKGVDVKTSGALSLEGYNAVVLTAGGIANAGTVQTLNVCGGCGNATIRSDLDNSGTLIAASNGLILDKTDGIYRNTGTVNVTGTLTIPASAGSPSFTLAGGSITSTAGNPGNADFRMLAGIFTYTGGDALSTSRGLVTIEGGDLVFNGSPTGTAAFSMLPSASGNTFTGNIGPTQIVRMPTVGGFATMDSRTLTLSGNVVNEGTLEFQPSPSSGFPILAGTGTLTNKGTLLSTGSGNDSLRIAINLRNEGTITSNGRFLQLDDPGLSFVNAGTIGGTGTLRAVGVTITNEATAHLDIVTDLRGGSHLRGTGTNAASLRLFDGSSLDPGFSPGIFTIGSLAGITGGNLNFELGGTAPGTQYDQIQASGSATISGAILNITAVNGFQAGKCGQVFDIITHNSPGGIGVFGTVNGLDQGNGRTLKVLYGKPIIRLVGLDAGKLVGTTTDPVPVAEGGATGSYAVCLGQAPTAPVTITPSPDAQVTVLPASVTFTASDWELPKVFTVTAVDDEVTEGTHTGRITQSVSSTDTRFNNFALGDVTATITDNDTNRNPTAANDNASTSQGMPVEIDVLANDADPDGDALTITAVTTQASGTASIINAGKKVRFTPASGFSGSATFGYTIEDGNGGSATAGVTVAVSAGSRVVNANWTTPEDTPLHNSPLAGPGECLDPSILSVTQPAHGTVVILQEGAPCPVGPRAVRFTPEANFVGTTSFAYTGIDWDGVPASGTVTIAVTPVNDVPTVANDNATTMAPNAVVVPVLVNDTDIDGDNLTVTTVTQPANGTATITGSGKTVTYTPPAGFSGTAQFGYTVSDGHGGSASASVTVSVAPGSADITWTTPEDTPYTSLVAASPGGGCSGQPRVLTVTQPANGRAVILTESFAGCTGFRGRVRFTPARDFTGTTSFTATGDYGFAGSGWTLRVNVIVTPVNDKPVARNDAATAIAGGAPVTINVLTNDSDVDNDVLSVTAVTGTATISADGRAILYSAPPRFSGTAQFRYTVSDGHGGTSQAQVRVTVTQAADLSIEADGSPDIAYNFQPITYTAIVRNLGPSASTGGVLIFSYTYHKFASAPRGPANCTSTLTTLTCPIPGIAPNGARTFRIVLNPGVMGGPLLARFTVAGAGDPNTANNAVDVSTDYGR
jgi:hypothetical protein